MYKRAVKTVASLLIMIMTGCCLVGCWDLEEITALAPVSAIGIDLGSEPGLLRFSVKFSLPAAGGGGAGNSSGHPRLRVLTVESESLIEAFAMLQSRTRRRHFYQHLEYIAFGADFARSGIGIGIETAQAWPQIRGSVLIFVAEGPAVDILNAHSGIGQDPAIDIADIIRSITTAPVARKMNLNDVIDALAKPGSTTLTLPILGLDPLALC